MTEQLKRYDITGYYYRDCGSVVTTEFESPDGQWVKASDIPKIKADAILASVADIGTSEPFARIVINHVKDYAERVRRCEV